MAASRPSSIPSMACTLPLPLSLLLLLASASLPLLPPSPCLGASLKSPARDGATLPLALSVSASSKATSTYVTSATGMLTASVTPTNFVPSGSISLSVTKTMSKKASTPLLAQVKWESSNLIPLPVSFTIILKTKFVTATFVVDTPMLNISCAPAIKLKAGRFACAASSASLTFANATGSVPSGAKFEQNVTVPVFADSASQKSPSVSGTLITAKSGFGVTLKVPTLKVNFNFTDVGVQLGLPGDAYLRVLSLGSMFITYKDIVATGTLQS